MTLALFIGSQQFDDDKADRDVFFNGEFVPIPGNPVCLLDGDVVDIRDYAWGADGSIYLIGAFNTVNGVAAVGITRLCIGGEYEAVGNSPFLDGFVPTKIVINAAGDIYVGSEGGLNDDENSYAFKFQNETWTSLQVDNRVRNMSVNPVTDDVWFAGSFTTFAGLSVGAGGGVAKYDGATATVWSADNNPYEVDFDSAGTVFVCGEFTVFDDLSIGTVAKSVDDGANWTQVGVGLSGGRGLTIKVDPNAETTLYLGGSFLGGTISDLKFFDGANWVEMPGITTGPNKPPSVSRFDPETGDLYMGGKFTSWNGLTVDNVIKYSGGAWVEAIGPFTSSFFNDVYSFRFHDLPTAAPVTTNFLRRFSLGRVEVTINRYTSAYTNGIFGKTLSCSFTAWASTQPYNTIEQDLVFEPQAGERVEEILIMYIGVEIFLSDNTSANPTSDIVLVKGRSYKPVKVETWDFLKTPHFRVLLRRFDGA